MTRAEMNKRLRQAVALLEVDGYELTEEGLHVWGVAGDRTYSLAEAEAFLSGVIAARGGAHLRLAAPGHDAGAFVKASRGEVA